MTELEKIERARQYMEKLANGINPIDNSEVPETDIVNNVRLSRCFFYVAGVLGQLTENGGSPGVKSEKKQKKSAFDLPLEQRAAFEYSDIPIPVSEIASRINALIDQEETRKISYSTITAWLVEAGFLVEISTPTGQKVKRPTREGMNLGITLEDRLGQNGPYQVVVYSRNAQQFVLDHLDAALGRGDARAELQWQPWSPEQDERLAGLFREGVPTYEIATTLKRTPLAVGARLKKLGCR